MKLLFNLIIYFTFMANNFVQAQKVSFREADSLFAEQQYTDAFKGYETQFRKGWASPGMLLKMAFIKEGLNDEVAAIYYLYQHYQLTYDRSSLQKARKLAEDQQLTGYAYSDRGYLLHLLKKYQKYLLLGLLVLLCLSTWYIYHSRKAAPLPWPAFVFQLVFSFLLVAVANNLWFNNRAIIQSASVLMSQPSAAAEPLATVEPGHLVEVIDERAAWVLIRWDSGRAYIRKQHIETI